MNRRYHIPSQITWHDQISAHEKARLRHAVLSAITRAVNEAATDRTEIVQVSSGVDEEPGERFEPTRFHSESESYSVPSYDDHGAPTLLPLRSAPDRKSTRLNSSH